jgi:hypothetical protein
MTDFYNTPSAFLDLSQHPSISYSASDGRRINNPPFLVRFGYSALTRLWVIVLWLALKVGLVADFFIDVEGHNWYSLIAVKAPYYDDPASGLPRFAAWDDKCGKSYCLKLWGMMVIISYRK